MKSNGGELGYLAFAFVGAAVLAFGVYQLQRSQRSRIVPQGTGRIVGTEYVSGVVNPYTGDYITGAQMGAIDWGV